MTQTIEAQNCPDCQQAVVPLECGERVGDGICTDLLCPVCGEELPDTPPGG